MGFPTHRFDSCEIPSVAFLVRCELGSPVVSATMWQVTHSAIVVMMPETTVHEDQLSATWEDDVWAAGQVTAVKPKSIAQVMEEPTNA